MNVPDLINGIYEFAGSLAIWMNVVRLFRDKTIKGCRWEPMVFFTSWSIWNLFYYPHLSQWFSLAGGACLMLANITWTIMAIYYTRKD